MVAAGSGVRLDAGMPKALAPLCGEPLLAHALRGVFGCAEVEHVIIVAPVAHVDHCWAVVGHAKVEADQVRVDVVAGGADRSASVEAGLAALRYDDGIVLVHDVARCLAPSGLFTRVIRDVRAGGPAVVPGLPVTDTIKVVDAQGAVVKTPDRESLRAIQTPQGFLREILEQAHASALAGTQAGAQNGLQANGVAVTDDAGLVERNGGQVRVVDGDQLAFKITSPLDLTVATALLNAHGE